MNFLKLYGAIVGSLTLVFYLIGAFICGTFNCGEWNAFFKFCLATIWVCHVWGTFFLVPKIKEFMYRKWY